jgi:hypothetical protein
VDETFVTPTGSDVTFVGKMADGDLVRPPPIPADIIASTRAGVVANSRWTGAILDPGRNNKGEGLISTDHSPVAVWVIPTDEERLIARHTAEQLH